MMNMHLVDWIIVAVLFGMLFSILGICRKYVKNTADFLVAGRCAGRYILSISDGIAGLGAITIVATFEMYYQAGFTPVWWSFISVSSGLTGIIIAATGWVYYRFRETKALTMPQFFEMRYSRKFRVFSGFLAWGSGMVNYGLFPAIAARFFLYFCGFPEEFRLFWGIPLTDIGAYITLETYPVLLMVLLTAGAFFAISGGQISIMVTDFTQGVFCNVAFLIIIAYLLFNISWDEIGQTILENSVPGASLVNPLKTNKIKEFNLWFFLIGIYSAFYVRGAWLGSQGYQGAARSPHEAKMATLLSLWRALAQNVLFILIPIVAFTVLHNVAFSDIVAQTTAVLAKVNNPQIRQQITTSVVLVRLLPVGLVGLFAAIMLAATVSTDNTYMHSWGSIFVQDVFMPIYRKKLSPQQHLKLLRFSICLVGVFAFFFSYFFRQTESIFLFFSITGAIFTGGAGAVIIGGLYWKRGTTKAAWAAMIAGSSLAVGNILLQQFSPQCFLKENGDVLINGQWGYFIAMTGAGLLYILVSLWDQRFNGRKDYNIDRLLHRGEYAEAKAVNNKVSPWRSLFPNENFTLIDKVILFATLGWGIGWTSVFVIGTLLELCVGISEKSWLHFWHYYISIGCILGAGTTIWFLIGGFCDIKKLFILLRQKHDEDSDDGTVSN